MSPLPLCSARCCAWLLLAALTPPLHAQDDAAPTRDSVSIQGREGFVEAVESIAQGEEAKGLAVLADLLAAHRDDPDLYILHYNVACGRARRKELDAAWAALETAVDLGYGMNGRMLENLALDPDLEALRSDAQRFGRLYERTRARAQEIQANLAAMTAPFSWVPPEPADPVERKPAPLLIVLHPFGVEREAFARERFLPWCEAQGFALLAPSGEVMLAPGRFAWAVSDVEFLERFRMDHRRIWQAVEAHKQRCAIDPTRIYVTGLGQGAALGFALAMRNPQWVRGALLFGGGYAPATLGEWLERGRAYGRRIALVHGKEDAIYPPAALPVFVAGLQSKGIDIELTPIEGGHALPAAAALGPLLGERLRWIDAAPFEAGRGTGR